MANATVPASERVPADGALPASAAVRSAERDFGIYVHIPYCRVRCGYCDFNTYTATELRGARRDEFAAHAVSEIDLAGSVLRNADVAERRVSTVFFGGGTPTILPTTDLALMLNAIRSEWSIDADAEITIEANPDSVDADALTRLADAGYTRVSVGMQSAARHVLAVLDRTHDPERVPLVAQWARAAGLSVSLDLIYGAPGESLYDWNSSIASALECEPDHVSAYALIVEKGTKLARQIRSGTVAGVDEDAQADMYEAIDSAMTASGYLWYEVSNWARSDAYRSRHNLAYWRGHDWWGVGPGAHSHIGGVRWWNVAHPRAYAESLVSGLSPAAGREILSKSERALERVLLETRTREGIALANLAPHGRRAVAGLVARGLIDAAATARGSVVLTRSGRLLADAVVRTLVDENAAT